jgi:signal transduction histidine kinase
VGKGTGQGLAIARSVVVDKLGGSIHFETEVGKGTTFIIRLPFDAETSLGKAAAASQSLAPAQVSTGS